MSLSKLQEIVKDREAWHAIVHVVAEPDWATEQQLEMPDYLTCLLRNLYAGQETTVRNGHGTVVPNRERSMLRLYIVTQLI